SLFPPAQAVQPDLREEDGTVFAQTVQPREVVLEGIPGFEVDVEAEKVEEWKAQVFGLGVIHVRDESIRIFLLGNPVQAFDEFFDATSSVPSDDRRGDLIADDVAEHGGVARTIESRSGFAPRSPRSGPARPGRPCARPS